MNNPSPPSRLGLCVVGSINLDIVARVRRLPARGETVMATAVDRHLGGKGANQAVAAARAGGRTRLVGRIGADAHGAWLAAQLAGLGVDISGVDRDASMASGQAFITVSDDAENVIVVDAGANAAWSLPSGAAQAIGDAGILLAQLETAIAPVAQLFAAASSRCLRILNAAPVVAGAAALFPDCDVIVVNETELAGYTGSAVNGDLASVAAHARSLLRRADQRIVVTLGSRGVVVTGASAANGATHLPARAVRVVDTVGAGDCFCGVLAVALAEGALLQNAAERANAAASLAVGRSGAAQSMPTRDEIDRVLLADPPRAVAIG